MIPRYTNPAMGAIWSDQRRYETWLEVELAAADAMAEAGVIPAAAAAELRTKAKFDVARIEALDMNDARGSHDLAEFTREPELRAVLVAAPAPVERAARADVHLADRHRPAGWAEHPALYERGFGPGVEHRRARRVEGAHDDDVAIVR